jgi:hypothetical protein
MALAVISLFTPTNFAGRAVVVLVVRLTVPEPYWGFSVGQAGNVTAPLCVDGLAMGGGDPHALVANTTTKATFFIVLSSPARQRNTLNQCTIMEGQGTPRVVLAREAIVMEAAT